MSKIRERNQQRSMAMREKEKRNRKMQVDATNEYKQFQTKKADEEQMKHYLLLNKDVSPGPHIRVGGIINS